MKLWRWEFGRQGGGYQKFTLLSSKLLKFDVHVLRLPRTSIVRHHRDSAPEGYEHHRVNITLRSAAVGGNTYIDRNTSQDRHYSLWRCAPAYYHFRPDLQEHYVTAVMHGELWILSFGWLRKKRTANSR